jgi:hypothetical protein
MIISVAYHTPHNRVNNTRTYVTLNTINGAVHVKGTSKSPLSIFYIYIYISVCVCVCLFYRYSILFWLKKRKEKITPVLNTGMNASPLALY